VKEGSDFTGAAEIVPDTWCVFNIVSSDVNMVWKRSFVVGEGLRARVSTIWSNVALYKVLASAAMSVCLAAWWMKRTSLLA